MPHFPPKARFGRKSGGEGKSGTLENLGFPEVAKNSLNGLYSTCPEVREVELKIRSPRKSAPLVVMCKLVESCLVLMATRN